MVSNKFERIFSNIHVAMLSLLLSFVFVACNSDDDTAPILSDEEVAFQQELDKAMSLAHVYGPETQQVAEEVAKRHNALYTELNYKSRESTERKCRTDHSRPLQLSDLARTMVVCHYDSIRSVLNDLTHTMKERNKFGRYKHQTSDYGYWGDLFYMQFEDLRTEIQVKSYSMFYATQPESVCRSVLGDSLFNAIHTETGQEPSKQHEYYEIMRADTTSKATYEYYRQLCQEYLSHFDPDFIQ